MHSLLRARSEQRHEAGAGHVPETLDLDEDAVTFAIARVKKYSAELEKDLEAAAKDAKKDDDGKKDGKKDGKTKK